MKLLDSIHSVVKILTVIIFTCIFSVTIAQVISRYVFSRSIFGAEEIVRYLFVWAIMLASGIAFYEGQHLSLDLFFQNPTWKQGIILLVLKQMVILSFIIIIIIHGFRLSFHNINIPSPALKVPLIIPYLGIPVGGCLLLLYDFSDIVHTVQLIIKTYNEK